LILFAYWQFAQIYGHFWEQLDAGCCQQKGVFDGNQKARLSPAGAREPFYYSKLKKGLIKARIPKGDFP